MRLMIAGGGYVGLTTAVGFARRGHTVDLVEIDGERAEQLRRGELPFDEPSLAGHLGQAVERSIRVHDRYPERSDCIDFAFVCVDTRQTETGDLDESRVFAAAEALLDSCGGFVRLVLRSTLNPGTAERLQSHLTERGRECTVLVNPEFLREGTALLDFDLPSFRVIGGSDEASLEALACLYSFSDAPIIRTDPATAAVVKMAVNASLAVRVSMANEIAYIAEAAGADVETALASVGADARIGRDYLQPGIGFGGSCLPKDLNAFRAFARSAGVSSNVFDGAAATNDDAIDRLVARTLALTSPNFGARVCVVGLGFKPGSSSLRASQAVRLVRALQREGLSVSVCDPVAEEHARAEFGDTVEYVTVLEEAASNHDVVIKVHPGGAIEFDTAPRMQILDGMARPLRPAHE